MREAAEERGTEQFDIAILGGGLFGAALAFHLAARSELRTVLIDPIPDPARPSGTDASAGILTLQGWDPWDLAVVRDTREEYRELAEEAGVDPLRPNGGLRVARTEEGARWLHRVHGVLEASGTPGRLVRPSEVRDLLTPFDLSDLRLGLYTPDDATIDPSALRAAYLGASQELGVLVRAPPAGPTPVPDGTGGWQVGTDRADRIVVACGAATKRVLAAMGHPVALAPFRSQAVRVRPRPLFASFPTLHDLDLELYARPAACGRLLVGDGTGTREEDPDRWELTADADFVERTTTALAGVVDGGATVTAESAWSGLCVASPDPYPLVGPVPGAKALYLASGFNGFGTMRAGGLARRLAEALRDGDWAELRPADPARFANSAMAFSPKPVFPLEDDVPMASLPKESDRRTAGASSSPRFPAERFEVRALGSLEEVDALQWAPLSEWFDPFLPLFAKDALRTGGRAEVALERGIVRGLFLLGSGEGVASGFTRHRILSDRFRSEAEAPGIYLETPGYPGATPVEIFAADLRDWCATGRARNPIHLARPEELPALRPLMRAELGPGVDPWFATLPRREETAFVCTLEGRPVGVSWLSRVGPFARGHSFVVHPRYRGLGIGTDLLLARMLWLRRTGARQVVSEIYDGNAASRTAAERAGMALVGRMFHVPAGGEVPVGTPTPEAPRTSDRPRPSAP